MNINSERKKLSIYIFLILTTLAVYWQVHQYDFVNIDDILYVTENNQVKSGITLDGVSWAFSTTFAEFWHPLTWLSFMLDYKFYGLDAGGYHLTNLILHVMSTLLLFWLFNRMTREIWKSAFVAALFSLHPMHVESVAWIAERKDVLSAFWGMMTLCLYVYYTEKQSLKRYLLVIISFILALLSKPMVVTLPVIMILLDYWPLGRFKFKKENFFLWQLKEKTIFFILSVIFSIIALFAHFKTPIQYHSLYERLSNAPVSLVAYLEKTFWPQDLAFYYPFSVQLQNWQVVGSAILIIFISIAVIVMVRRLPYFFGGWLWFLITIMPVIGIIKISSFAMADRYHYLPSIGIAVIIAWGIPTLIKNEKIKKNILFPSAIAFLLLLSTLAWKQCGYWKNSIRLSNHALQVTTNNHLAHEVIGYALLSEGKIQDAVNHFSDAIRINPYAYNSYKNRGIAYFNLSQYQRAIEDMTEAIRLKPNDAPLYFLRGNIYSNLGRYQQAIEDYDKAIRLNQNYADAYNSRGGSYYNIGRIQMAIQDYSAAIRLKQDYAEAYNNRAFVYMNHGEEKRGCNDAQEACKLKNCRILEGAKKRGFCR